jgi:hypothetical protein
VLAGQPGSGVLDEARRVLSDDVGHLEGWLGHRSSNLRERFTVSGLDTVAAPRCWGGWSQPRVSAMMLIAAQPPLMGHASAANVPLETRQLTPEAAKPSAASKMST